MKTNTDTHTTRCQCCLEPTPDITRRFDETHGFICTDCHDFSAYAAKRLRRVGIEGVTVNPIRFTP